MFLNTLKNTAVIAGLTVAIPLSIGIAAVAVVHGWARARTAPRSDRPQPTTLKKTVLLSGGKMTKALQLARSLHAAGHDVILAETFKYRHTAHRYSRAVKRFYTIPAPDAAEYADALITIIKREAVDVYIPVCSPVASLYDSAIMPKLGEYCEVVHVGPDDIQTLDNKFLFAQTATALGLRVPKSILVRTVDDVLNFDFAAERRSYILKSIAYDSVRRLDLTRLPCETKAQTEAFVRSLPISPDNPWVMQEFIPGTEFCTHGTYREGELRAYCCCRSSAFQVNYAHEDVAAIEEWVRRFGSALGLTGQASMDFIRADDDGEYYAIECNPRTHSAITMFYNHPELATAYLGGALSSTPITPLLSSRATYWLYHEIWRCITAIRTPHTIVERLRIIFSGKEAVLDWRDPLPFLMLYHRHIPLLLIRDMLEQRGWLRIDFNIGKLVQAGGD